jgi:hypothetical protein
MLHSCLDGPPRSQGWTENDLGSNLRQYIDWLIAQSNPHESQCGRYRSVAWGPNGEMPSPARLRAEIEILCTANARWVPKDQWNTVQNILRRLSVFGWGRPDGDDSSPLVPDGVKTQRMLTLYDDLAMAFLGGMRELPLGIHFSATLLLQEQAHV